MVEGVETLVTLAESLADRPRLGLAGQGGDFAGQPLGFGILDV